MKKVGAEERPAWWASYLVRKIMKSYGMKGGTATDAIAFAALDTAFVCVLAMEDVADRFLAAGEALVFGRRGIRR